VLHRVVDATHTGLLEDQGPANESAGAVVEVVDAVRTGGAVTSR
jgi:hypothetical protein